MFEKHALFQHAYLVNDLEEAAEAWARTFGAGPFYATRRHRTDQFMYRGTDEEACVSYAFGFLGDLQIQFIQQHDEKRSIYRDMFRPGEQGFHHIAYLVHDFAAARQRLLDQGFELACELFADEVNAAYFDTRPINGVFTEIHGDPGHILASFAIQKRAHDAWDGTGPALRERVDRPVYVPADFIGIK